MVKYMDLSLCAPARGLEFTRASTITFIAAKISTRWESRPLESEALFGTLSSIWHREAMDPLRSDQFERKCHQATEEASEDSHDQIKMS